MIAINFADDVPSAYYNNACSSCAENFGELFGILQERVIFFSFFSRLVGKVITICELGLTLERKRLYLIKIIRG